MSNPALSSFTNKWSTPISTPADQSSNSLFGMYNRVRNSPNPDKAAQELLQTIPQFKGILDYINQNGGDAKTAFYNMAAQKGTNPNIILDQLR